MRGGNCSGVKRPQVWWVLSRGRCNELTEICEWGGGCDEVVVIVLFLCVERSQ
jgi:hypothetical protein